MKKSLLILVAVLVVVAVGWVWVPMQREYSRIQDEAFQASLTPVAPVDEISEGATETTTDAVPEATVLPPVLAARVAALEVGQWRLATLTDASGQVVEIRRPEEFTLRFTTAGQVSGETDCNNFSGRYELTENDDIRMGPFAMTKMACPDSQEQLFLAAVTAATSQTILPSGTLELRADTSGAVVVLEQIIPPPVLINEVDQATSSEESAVSVPVTQ